MPLFCMHSPTLEKKALLWTLVCNTIQMKVQGGLREHWEKVNHVYTLGERLLDLMKTPPSASAEDSWIKATCALVLAIPEKHQDYERLSLKTICRL